MQAPPEVIDLCSTTSVTSSGEDENELIIFSPVKPKIESPPSTETKCDSVDVLKQMIPNVAKVSCLFLSLSQFPLPTHTPSAALAVAHEPCTITFYEFFQCNSVS